MNKSEYIFVNYMISFTKFLQKILPCLLVAKKFTENVNFRKDENPLYGFLYRGNSREIGLHTFILPTTAFRFELLNVYSVVAWQDQ